MGTIRVSSANFDVPRAHYIDIIIIIIIYYYRYTVYKRSIMIDYYSLSDISQIRFNCTTVNYNNIYLPILYIYI